MPTGGNFLPRACSPYTTTEFLPLVHLLNLDIPPFRIKTLSLETVDKDGQGEAEAPFLYHHPCFRTVPCLWTGNPLLFLRDIN